MFPSDTATKGAWLIVAAIHLPPAAVLVAPHLVERLYSVTVQGPAGLLLLHRGALFLTVVVTAMTAAFDPSVRRLASIVVTISIVAYLALYARAGFPEGSLRTVGLIDAVALVPLMVVAYEAWWAPDT